MASQIQRVARLESRVGMLSLKFHEAMEKFAGIHGEVKILKWVAVAIAGEIALKMILGGG